MDTQTYYGLLPEWAPQDSVLLAWPHSHSDWLPVLEEVHRGYVALICAITRFEPVIILCDHGETPLSLLPSEVKKRVTILQIPFNDTWVRDYGPLSFYDTKSQTKQFLGYTFNGWGLKYRADLDNQVLPELMAREDFRLQSTGFRNYRHLSLEGGGIEANGKGTILINGYWLDSPNRNESFSPAEIRRFLLESLGAKHIIEVDCLPLEGDDTDGHIDTIVRFASENQLAYVAPSCEASPNYQALCRLESQVKALKNSEGDPFDLIPLPDVGLLTDNRGDVLPASYANFLFVNGGIILPTYGKEETDAEAREILAKAFPKREVVPVSAEALIKWHGSIHCATMQVSEGFLK